jgi:hypothetical protein
MDINEYLDKFSDDSADSVENQQEELSLIKKVSEQISTDPIAELKSGIYNLFIALYNNLIVEYGVEEAIKKSTDFLDDISYNFKKILTDYKETNLP